MNNKTIIETAIKSNVPIMLWGDPGTGKTAYITDYAEKNNIHVETLIGSTLDPSDVCGIPFQFNGTVKLAPPEWAMRIKKSLERGEDALLFLDELSCASHAVQASLLRVVQSRQVGDISIKNCRIVAACNPTETAADGGELPAATSNRWAHIEWTVDVSEWITGELTGWGKKIDYKHASATSKICSFIKSNPKALLDVPKNIEDHSRAWPSPRSWSNAALLLSNLENEKNFEKIIASCVGNPAAREFSIFIQNMDLPNPEEILLGKAKIPNRGDQQYATVFSLVSYGLSQVEKRDETILKIWEIIGTLRPDIALSPAKALLKGAPEIYSDVAAKIGNKILDITNE